MRTYAKLSIVLALFLALPAMADDNGKSNLDPTGKWKQIGEKDGIKTWKSVDEDPNGLIGFRGEGVIDAPLEKLGGVFFDPDRAPEWVDSLVQTKIPLWASETSYVEYDHFTAPWPIADRDFLSLVTLKFDRSQNSMTYTFEECPENLSVPAALRKNDDYVRATDAGTKYVLTPIEGGTKTYLVGEVHVDMRGHLPHWVVNFIQQDWAYLTFTGLRKQVAKKDIKEIPKISALIHKNLGGRMPANKQSKNEDN